MKTVLYMLFGFIIGSVVTVYAMTHLMKGRMVEVMESNMSVEETVTTLETNAKAVGWKVPKIYDMQKSLSDEGYDIAPMKVLSICKPQYAYNILSDDNRTNISALMPCRVSVFETGDGRVWIARMNGTIAGRVFGGVVADMMTKVSDEQDAMFKGVLK